MKNTIQQKIKLNLRNYDGAIAFIQITNNFSDLNFDVQQNHTFIDGKSLLGILSLDLSKNIIVFVDKEFDSENFKQFEI